jgi:hypothetical protein
MSDSKEYGIFDSINFFIRPKKQIERKIIIEILQALKEQINLNEYKYIGFGSIYYYDFILFHKLLNLTKLHSIDDKSSKKRFDFNKPYDFISFENKFSTDFLNSYTWDTKSFIRLDYDKILSDWMLNDLKVISRNCLDKDILICTIKCKCEDDDKKRETARLEFVKKFGKYIKPTTDTTKAFTPKNLHNLIQEVILNYLYEACEFRDIKFKKLFCFIYKDTAPMISLAVIFGLKKTLEKIECKNEFVDTGMGIKEINVPILTYREKDWLDFHIKEVEKKVIEIEKEVDTMHIVDEEEQENKKKELINTFLPFEVNSFDLIKNYVEYYRYYPQYYEGMI